MTRSSFRVQKILHLTSNLSPVAMIQSKFTVFDILSYVILGLVFISCFYFILNVSRFLFDYIQYNILIIYMFLYLVYYTTKN